MTGNRNFTAQDWTDDEDAPDLSTPEWQEKLARVAVRRGRPRSARPKVSTTIRLDADVLAYFRASGPGWQSRVNALLRGAMPGR